MLVTNFALAVATFASSAEAFFPYVPGYRCDLDNSCPEKRAVDAEPLSLKIVQRLPEVKVPVIWHVASLTSTTEWLAPKRRASRGKPQTQVPESTS